MEICNVNLPVLFQFTSNMNELVYFFTVFNICFNIDLMIIHLNVTVTFMHVNEELHYVYIVD